MRSPFFSKGFLGHLVLTQAAAVEPEVYWQMARYQDAIIEQLARAKPRLAHLSSDPAARGRAVLALSQIDHACYFLAVRHWANDPSDGISIMADNLEKFLREEARRGRAR